MLKSLERKRVHQLYHAGIDIASSPYERICLASVAVLPSRKHKNQNMSKTNSISRCSSTPNRSNCFCQMPSNTLLFNNHAKSCGFCCLINIFVVSATSRKIFKNFFYRPIQHCICALKTCFNISFALNFHNNIRFWFLSLLFISYMND